MSIKHTGIQDCPKTNQNILWLLFDVFVLVEELVFVTTSSGIPYGDTFAQMANLN